MFLPHPRVKLSIVGSLRDREVAFSASDRQSSNFESCVWRIVSSHSSHHLQEVLLAQFSLYVHKGGLKPDSFTIPVLLHQLDIYCVNVFIYCFNHLHLLTIPFISSIDVSKEIYEIFPLYLISCSTFYWDVTLRHVLIFFCTWEICLPLRNNIRQPTCWYNQTYQSHKKTIK